MKTESLKSLLFVPATSKMLAKVGTFEADAYILDLEDSISPDDKEDALRRVSGFLSNNWTSRVYVRVNSDNFERELAELDKFDIGFMLPKFEIASFYDPASAILAGHDVIALVETPRGVVDIEQIVRTPWVDSIAFGAEDYTAAVNIANRIEYLSYQKSRLVTFAKAFGKKIFDTPSFKLDDNDEFIREVDNAVSLGFDGKLAISPRHLTYINESFRNGDIDYMKSIIAQFESSYSGVVVVDGKVYEKPHIERLKKIIREHGK